MRSAKTTARIGRALADTDLGEVGRAGRRTCPTLWRSRRRRPGSPRWRQGLALARLVGVGGRQLGHALRDRLGEGRRGGQEGLGQRPREERCCRPSRGSSPWGGARRPRARWPRRPRPARRRPVGGRVRLALPSRRPRRSATSGLYRWRRTTSRRTSFSTSSPSGADGGGLEEADQLGERLVALPLCGVALARISASVLGASTRARRLFWVCELVTLCDSSMTTASQRWLLQVRRSSGRS